MCPREMHDRTQRGYVEVICATITDSTIISTRCRCCGTLLPRAALSPHDKPVGSDNISLLRSSDGQLAAPASFAVAHDGKAWCDNIVLSQETVTVAAWYSLLNAMRCTGSFALHWGGPVCVRVQVIDGVSVVASHGDILLLVVLLPSVFFEGLEGDVQR